MREIHVDIGLPDRDIGADWADLLLRARANVFMHPAALRTVADTHFAKVHVLLAWDRGSAPARLVGVWALQQQRIFPMGPSVLVAPPYEYSFLSDPVIDPEAKVEVIAAFYAAIERDPDLPKVLRLKYVDADGDFFDAIQRAAADQSGQSLTLLRRDRPFATKEDGIKPSGSTRKKLRQDWKRLAANGAVEIVNDRTASAAREAFEIFLKMEEHSWKGESGTALLCRSKDAAFARQLIANLAAAGSASVALLTVDGRPIACQVLLYSGNVAYTWKIAFSAEFAKFSPGSLLVDKLTETLLATDEITGIESCSPEGGFMSQIWTGRRASVDLLIDVNARKSATFALALLHERGYAQLKTLRHTWLPNFRGGRLAHPA